MEHVIAATVLPARFSLGGRALTRAGEALMDGDVAVEALQRTTPAMVAAMNGRPSAILPNSSTGCGRSIS
jgi:hypothetical protein